MINRQPACRQGRSTFANLPTGQAGRQSCRGFTLIELLVVIAIISLLVSILLPSLNKAKELAKRSVCASNFKNIGTAMVTYAEDNNAKYPSGRADHWPNGDFSLGTGPPDETAYPSPGPRLLEPDYISVPSVFFCPSGHRTAETDWPITGTVLYYAGCCYWANYIVGDLTDEVVATSLLSAPDTVTASDTMSQSYPSWSSHLDNGKFIGGNVLYNDTHVEWKNEGQTEQRRDLVGVDFWF